MFLDTVPKWGQNVGVWVSVEKTVQMLLKGRVNKSKEYGKAVRISGITKCVSGTRERGSFGQKELLYMLA